MTRHLALVGPTASGKSTVALAVAVAAGDVEIVTLDSMQVYRQMDIGTAKPTPAEQALVPHHLVDIADPAEDWSVAQTQRHAAAVVADIESRGRRALLVGGTGLYVRAVIDGLEIPGRDLAVRAELLHETEAAAGVAQAYARLQQLDPLAAGRMEPTNRRRIVRALEVIGTTGRRFSSFGPGFDSYGAPVLDIRLVGIWWPRAILDQRIRERVIHMRDAGLLDEVRRLEARPTGVSRTAAQAIGYAELLEYVRGEQPSLPEAFERAMRRTRRFSRRQRMWFRRDPRVHWLAAPGKVADLAPAILATWNGSVPATAA